VVAGWSAALALGLPLLHAAAAARAAPTILLRKGYHVLALAMFAPAALAEPGLLAVGAAAAAAGLAAAEVLRGARVPVVGPPIHAFMARFVDDRDSGALLVSHFSLLAGMAGPVWMSGAASATSTPLPDAAPALAGVVALGALDAAASAVGRAVGRAKLCGTAKTWEGAAAGATAAALAWAALGRVGAPLPPTSAAVACALTAWLEAATTQLDNIFLPLHHAAVVAAGAA
jgi:dolichol kinase